MSDDFFWPNYGPMMTNIEVHGDELMAPIGFVHHKKAKECELGNVLVERVKSDAKDEQGRAVREYVCREA